MNTARDGRLVGRPGQPERDLAEADLVVDLLEFDPVGEGLLEEGVLVERGRLEGQARVGVEGRLFVAAGQGVEGDPELGDVVLEVDLLAVEGADLDLDQVGRRSSRPGRPCSARS